MYDHKIDQKDFKWSGKSILKKLKINIPDYINLNKQKYKEWLD